MASSEMFPLNWEQQAEMAWRYYTEKPIVKNRYNSWRAFALGDKLNVLCENTECKEVLEKEIYDSNIFEFIKDMILQLLVKGDAVGFKKEENYNNISKLKLICVNPTSVDVLYKNGHLVKAVQTFDEELYGDNIVNKLVIPLEQIIHLKWDAPPF